LHRLQEWINLEKPDVVVIDTIRSAWSGFDENSAKDWARINQFSLRIRNAGISCVLVHHANKPGESGPGSYAGSTNQLTTLETQIRVTQVFHDEETAKLKAGIYDGNYSRPIWPQLMDKLPSGYRLYMVNEVSYGKVREWSDVHDQQQWIGYAAHDDKDEVLVVASSSTKQRAKSMALEGMDHVTIGRHLGRPSRLVREWLEAK